MSVIQKKYSLSYNSDNTMISLLTHYTANWLENLLEQDK